MSLFSKNKVKMALRWLLIVFYFFAGLNHFINPQFYLPLIPPYIPNPDLINVLSGIAEMVLALGVAIPAYRKKSSLLLILLLVVFIPAHIYFIQLGACVGELSLCVPIWVAWVRLLPFHPLLMYWAWYVK